MIDFKVKILQNERKKMVAKCILEVVIVMNFEKKVLPLLQLDMEYGRSFAVLIIVW